MLSTGSAGTVGIDPQIIIIDLYLQILFYIRHNIAGCKGSLPLSGRIKRGYPHQTMNAPLRLQITVSILTVNLNRYRLNTCFLAVQIVQNFYLKSLLFCPTGVHPI